MTRALSLMADGGILFSLLPMGCMFGANEEKVWRETELLARNTLLAVISLRATYLSQPPSSKL